MTHVSLFTGIGGIDLAAERAGFRTIAQVEKDPYCLAVLAKHWPDVHRCPEIRDFPDRDFGAVTLVSGGFPCQPFSTAGKRRGRSDDRHLWPDMLRVIRVLKSRWVLAENVLGLLTIDSGLAFETMCTDLENQNYEIQPIIIPAGAAGTRHKRYRVFILAFSKRNGIQGRKTNWEGQKGQEGARKKQLARFLPDVPWPSVSFAATYGNDYGIPRGSHRNRVLGNAVVPQQVYPILRAISETERIGPWY